MEIQVILLKNREMYHLWPTKIIQTNLEIKVIYSIQIVE